LEIELTAAVLVIDVQRGLCEGAWATFDASRVVNRINAVTAKARDSGVPVVFIQHEEDAGLVYGSEYWQLSPKLVVTTEDMKVRKTTADSFHKTELASILAAKGVTKLVICGMQTDFCVDTTVRRALALGFPIDLVSDGHTTLSNKTLAASQIIDHHNETLSSIESFGNVVRLKTAEEVIFTA
jgi:nicotinamidase-related amidase